MEFVTLRHKFLVDKISYQADFSTLTPLSAICILSAVQACSQTSPGPAEMPACHSATCQIHLQTVDLASFFAISLIAFVNIISHIC
jgi:hypothetical protein